MNHETGAIGVAAGPDLRLRPATTDGLRQVERGRVRALAALLGRAEVERAYGFTRRPFTLGLERVDEAPVANANVRVRAQVAANRYEVEALVRYDVRRGALYALELAFPKALELLEATPGRGLDVRGTDQRTDGEARILRLDLGTGLRGSGQVTLRLARRLALDQGAVGLPFPEVRARGVAQESGAVAIAADPRLELRAPGPRPTSRPATCSR